MSFLDSKTEPPAESIIVEKDGKTTKEPNPAYNAWVATDQQVLTFLLGSLTPDILVSVIGMDTAAEVWEQSRRCLLPSPERGSPISASPSPRRGRKI
jgi:hypothetical protein